MYLSHILQKLFYGLIIFEFLIIVLIYEMSSS